MESFILLPMITMSMPLGSLPKPDITIVPGPQIVSSQQENIEAESLLAFNQALDLKAKTIEAQGEAIDAYFKAHKMPLEGTGKKMAEEADKNDLDWRLLPAISVQESTGGKHACKKVANSFFGWGSCKIGFKSKEEAIESLARNLSGNDKDTAHHYQGKTTKEILQKYNPPSIHPKYSDEVMRIMSKIGEKDVVLTPSALTSSYDLSVQKG